MSKPHLRRECWLVAGVEVWVWACRTIERVGVAMSWRAAHAAWERASQRHMSELLEFDLDGVTLQ